MLFLKDTAIRALSYPVSRRTDHRTEVFAANFLKHTTNDTDRDNQSADLGIHSSGRCSPFESKAGWSRLGNEPNTAYRMYRQIPALPQYVKACSSGHCQEVQ